MNRMDKIRNHLEFFILGCFFSSIFFYTSLFFSYGSNYSHEPYYFFIVQAISGVFAVLLPYYLRKRKVFPFSPLLHCYYLIFLFFSLFLGELCHFYLFFSWWDLLLHFFSGVLLFYASLEWFRFSSQPKEQIHYASFLVLSILLALSLCSLWEIYEFLSDGIFGTNMQRFISSNGTAFVGRTALFDTMEDLIFDVLGSISGAVFLITNSKKEIFANF